MSDDGPNQEDRYRFVPREFYLETPAQRQARNKVIVEQVAKRLELRVANVPPGSRARDDDGSTRR